MFNNVGGSLKGIATIVCWLGIICSCIAGIMGIMSGVEINNNYYSDGSGTTLIVGGLVIMVVGSILSWVSSLAVYGFGELVENSSIIRKQLQDIEGKMNSNAGTVSSYQPASSSVSNSVSSRVVGNQTTSSNATNTVEKKQSSTGYSVASPKSKDEVSQIVGEDVEWIDVDQAGEMGQKLLSLGLYKDKMLLAPVGMSEEEARTAGYRSWKYMNGSKQYFRSIRTVPALNQEQYEKVLKSKA